MSEKKVIDFKVGDTVCCNCGECKKEPVTIQSFIPTTIGIVAVFSDPGVFPIKYMPIDQLELADLSTRMTLDEITGRINGLQKAYDILSSHGVCYGPASEEIESAIRSWKEARNIMLDKNPEDTRKSPEVPTPGDVLNDSFEEFLDEVSGVFLNLLKKAMQK